MLDRFNGSRQLQIEHDMKYGLISIHCPGHMSAAPELSVAPATINISSEDFATMLKWYMYQKSKEENREAILWNEVDDKRRISYG